MAYKLYTDKLNKFSCNIQVEGTSFANSKVRLIIESEGMSYLFNGNIHNTGVCDVSIPKVKNFLSESSKGLMRLEVIADDVYFEPWSSDFYVLADKKVTIESAVNETTIEKPKVKVVVEEPIQQEPLIKETKNTSKKFLSKQEMLELLYKDNI
jgi:hypothetical protein